MNSLSLKSLYVYPIKSCAGIKLDRTELDSYGIGYDRKWMIWSESQGFITQRLVPRLALVKPRLNDSELILGTKDMPDFRLPLKGISLKHEIEVKIWNESVSADDQGDDIATWLQSFTHVPDARLVRMRDQGLRNFSDSRPLLVISEASLHDLNSRMAIPLPIDRFRPNLVIGGCDAYAEDSWKSIQVGSITLSGSKSCIRCMITTIDQATGEKKGKEPLKTLNTFRRRPEGVIFGRYFVNESIGQISVEDVLHAA